MFKGFIFIFIIKLAFIKLAEIMLEEILKLLIVHIPIFSKAKFFISKNLKLKK